MKEKKQQLITLNKRIYGRLMITQSTIDDSINVNYQGSNMIINGTGSFFKKTQVYIDNETNCNIKGNSWSCHLTKWHFFPIGRELNIIINDSPFSDIKKSKTLSLYNYCWLNIVFILTGIFVLVIAFFFCGKILYERKKYKEYMLLPPKIFSVIKEF